MIRKVHYSDPIVKWNLLYTFRWPCHLSHYCWTVETTLLLSDVLVELPDFPELPDDLPVGCFPGDFFINSSSKTCERKYCPSSLFMMASPLFLISIASLIQRLYRSCSVPITFASFQPMTWLCSTTWSVTADLWTVDNDSFRAALVWWICSLFPLPTCAHPV